MQMESIRSPFDIGATHACTYITFTKVVTIYIYMPNRVPLEMNITIFSNFLCVKDMINQQKYF